MCDDETERDDCYAPTSEDLANLVALKKLRIPDQKEVIRTLDLLENEKEDLMMSMQIAIQHASYLERLENQLLGHRRFLRKAAEGSQYNGTYKQIGRQATVNQEGLDFVRTERKSLVENIVQMEAKIAATQWAINRFLSLQKNEEEDGE